MVQPGALRVGRPPVEGTLRGTATIDVALGFLAVALITLLTAFFVAAEFALVASDRKRIEQLAAEGVRGAGTVLAALRTLSFQLSGAQLGITVTSLLVGFIVEPTIGEALAPIITTLGVPEPSALGVSVTFALILATALQMVVGELIPKNVAVAKPWPVGRAVVGPLRVVNSLFKPVIRFLNASANATVRLLGIEPREELNQVRSLEELELLIRSSGQEGALPEEELSLLVHTLRFRDKTASDALTPRTSMCALSRDSTLAEMTRRALETGHSRFPVLGDGLDDIVGVAHVKDSHAVPYGARAHTTVEAIMQEPLMVPESRPLPLLLGEMRGQRKHLAVVLDEYGGTAGIITLEDLIEEIVGDIEDEYDPTAMPQAEAGPPSGEQVLSGLLHRDEVAEAVGLEMPEGDFDTLGGFVLDLLGHIPVEGERARYDGWELEVVAMERKRIDKVLVVVPPPQGTARTEGS